jgi:DNA-binding CsgD family transcriptional regulator
VEYLSLAIQGHTQSEIAGKLGVNERTAAWYAQGLFAHLGARSIAQAVHLAYVQGIIGRVPERPRLVPAGPTLGAIRQMLAAGWPLLWQARQAGVSAAAMHRLLRREVVLAETETRVLATARRLLGRDPVEAGVDPRVVARARNEAQRRGWVVVSS